jgi:hypothetical protein
MANPDVAFGLRPKQQGGGVGTSGQIHKYYIPSTDTAAAAYIGCLVKPAGSADADGIMSVTSDVSSGDSVVGVVVAVEPVTRESTIYRENSTSRYVYVADDPNQIFLVQDDASATLAATDVGSTADLTGFTSGSTASGLSSIEISATTATSSGDGTEDVLILGLHRTPDNTIGDNAIWEVRLNNHFYVDGVAGA